MHEAFDNPHCLLGVRQFDREGYHGGSHGD
jgi:hypothetical protein